MDLLFNGLITQEQLIEWCSPNIAIPSMIITLVFFSLISLGTKLFLFDFEKTNWGKVLFDWLISIIIVGLIILLFSYNTDWILSIKNWFN